MNRELNELKSRAINRAGFIGTVINMPQASRGVGSGIFSTPHSLFATKKGKEILRPGPCSPTSTTTIHHHMTKTPAHVSRNIGREENPGTGQFGEALGDRGCPVAPQPAVFDRGAVRGEGSRARDFQSTPGRRGPHPGRSGQRPPPTCRPGSSSLRASCLLTARAACQPGRCVFISSSGIHTITWAVAK